MFEKLKIFFSKSVKTSKEVDTTMNELKNTVEKFICKYEGNTNECSLIKELKSKQAMKKTIEDCIKSYDNHSNTNVENIWRFLATLEKNGFRMNSDAHSYNSSDINEMFIHEGTYRLEHALNYFSLTDIDNIANELKALKQNTIIVREKKAVLKALEDDIADIKNKLGIE